MRSNLIHKFRSLFFSPESTFELWARSLYHRITATKLHFIIQDWLARRSYRRWIKQQQTEILPEIDALTEQPIITFLVDCQNRKSDQLHTTLESIKNLHGGCWQALLISPPSHLLDKFTSPKTDKQQIKIINEEKPNLLEDIDGEFVVFCQAGDRFFPSLLHRFYLLLANSNAVDLAYYDCEIQNSERHSPTPVFKPGKPSPALFLSFNVFSRAIIRTAKLKGAFESAHSQAGLLLKEYEICLKSLEFNAKIQHIPAVLVSQTELVKPESQEAQQIVLEYLSRSGLQNPSAVKTPQGTCFHWSSHSPSISIIIPTKNNARLLEPLLKSILNHQNQQNLMINIVDNNSDDPKTLAYYRTIESDSPIRILPYNKPFNYSKAINLGVSEAESDLVLLMNDDMQPINASWLEEMSQWAQREDIGVVGAKLLRANHTLQHAGIIMGLVGIVGHIYLNAPEHYFGLWGSADWYRDLLAVTGACQMMRREVFDQVGGYDEGFRLAFGDVDFCLRVHRQGYRNILTPFARLYHYEGRSRGYITPVDDILRAYDKFLPFLTEDDPFFSPNMTYTRIPHCALSRTSSEQRKKQIKIRHAFYKKK